jgi:hypothetical protein
MLRRESEVEVMDSTRNLALGDEALDRDTPIEGRPNRELIKRRRER